MTEQNLIKLDRKLTDLIQSDDYNFQKSKRGASITNDLKVNGKAQRGIDLNYTMSVSSKQSGRSDVSHAQSHRSRSSVIKEAGNLIVRPNSGASNNNAPLVQDEDYWNKIIMFNVDQFHREQEEAKQRLKENQQSMKQ